jgi:hypothetical protein
MIDDKSPLIKNDVRLGIFQRINQIVDSKIEPHVRRSWTLGGASNTKYPRTARMIAVCWVLVCMFDCTIKGGFVRDWVINQDEWLPNGSLNNLLSLNPRNKYLEVTDEKITPSDIDAELSHSMLFD